MMRTILILCSLCLSAHSYELYGFKWQHRVIPVSCPSDVRKSAKTTLKEWSKVTGLKFKLVKYVDSGIEIVRGDTDNFLAITGVTHINGRVWHSKIVLSNKVSWSGNNSLTRNVLRHELGHSIGLGHSSDFTAIMFELVGDTERDLSSDDIMGAKAIYEKQGPAPK